MILNTKRIHNFFWRNFPVRAKQTPSKVLFVAKKKATTAAVRSSRAKIVIVGNSKWVKKHHFVLNYLTVLVYTKTIIHRSWGG